MAGRNVWRSFHRVCQQSRNGVMPIARGAYAAAKDTKKPAWLLAAAPFVWNPPNMSQPPADEEEDDEEYEDDDEEGQEDVQSQRMRNWSTNAESHPEYRKTVREAQKILSTPPPPPPKFPEFPQGFCIDPEKVPPKPPLLPRLRHIEFHDDNANNSKKLPSQCPQKPVALSETALCPPQHMAITPKMPDMPFCDAPIPPPALPAPPPCGELGPPPPPPPNPPALLQRVEKAPPPLPAPPPMYYDLPPPPSVFTPHSNSKIPPLPCLPEKNGEVSMAKCTNDNNENNAMGVLQLPRTAGTEYYEVQGSLRNNNASTLPPPPPTLSTQSMSTASYWSDDSQLGMIAAPPAKPKLRRKKKKGKGVTVMVDENGNETHVLTTAMPEEISVEEAPLTPPEVQEEQFEVLWSSRGRKNR